MKKYHWERVPTQPNWKCKLKQNNENLAAVRIKPHRLKILKDQTETSAVRFKPVWTGHWILNSLKPDLE